MKVRNLQSDTATLACVDHSAVLVAVLYAAVFKSLLLFILGEPALHGKLPKRLDLGARQLAELLEAVLCVCLAVLYVDVLKVSPYVHNLHPGALHRQLIYSLEVEH